MVRIAIITVFSALLLSCVSNNPAHFDAVVKKSCGKTKNCFTSIQSAINSAPEDSSASYQIFIYSGTYSEKILLTKNNLKLIGQGGEKTRIAFGDYAGKEFEAGKTLTTPGSATLTIKAKNILLQDISVENSFNFLANDMLASDDPKRISGSQAVALFIDIPSDKVIVRNVTMLGYQDTLFVNSGRSWFDKVLVAGNVDYIFGNGNALFTQSEIKTVARGKANNPHGFITAPSTQINSQFGLTFLDCRLTRDKSVPDNSTSLGRPWHPTTIFADGRYADPNAIGKSVFINTWMDSHITVDGWFSMSGTAKEGGRKNFLPEDARLFEYKNTGPGAIVNSKHRQLSTMEAEKYTRENIFGDWVSDIN